MSWNPFTAVSSYAAMLDRIAIFTLIFSLACISILRSQVTSIDQFLASWSVSVPVGGVSFPLGTVVPAGLLALVSRIFKLHDRISDLLRIRHRFDVNNILLPLALGSGAAVTIDKIKKIGPNRSHLMYATFYKYASSDPDKTVIDKHKVTMALDMWGWYWVFVEGNTLALITGCTLFLLGDMSWAAALFAAVLLSLWILQGIKAGCSKYALAEVTEILEDSARKESIADAFNAL